MTLTRLVERRAIPQELVAKLPQWRHPGFSAYSVGPLLFRRCGDIRAVACLPSLKNERTGLACGVSRRTRFGGQTLWTEGRAESPAGPWTGRGFVVLTRFEGFDQFGQCNPSALDMNTAIWPRVMGSSGQ